MAAIFGEGKIFFKLQRIYSLDTLWVENFDLSRLFNKMTQLNLEAGVKVNFDN